MDGDRVAIRIGDDGHVAHRSFDRAKRHGVTPGFELLYRGGEIFDFQPHRTASGRGLPFRGHVANGQRSSTNIVLDPGIGFIPENPRGFQSGASAGWR